MQSVYDERTGECTRTHAHTHSLLSWGSWSESTNTAFRKLCHPDQTGGKSPPLEVKTFLQPHSLREEAATDASIRLTGAGEAGMRTKRTW